MKKFKKPKWADGPECEVCSGQPTLTFILRWPEWAHRFTLAGGADLMEAGIMDQIKALWLGLCPDDWDMVGAEHVQRVPFAEPSTNTKEG